MNKYLFFILFLLIILISVSSVSAVNNINNLTDNIVSMSDNGYYDITFNKLDSSFNFLYSNYSLKDRELVLNNVSFNDFNNTSNIENQNILLNNSINLVNSYLYHKNINNKSINVTLTKNILKNNSVINSTNIT